MAFTKQIDDKEWHKISDYWRLKEQYEGTTKDPAEKGGESCPYDYVKKTFTQKIDELIKHRMAL